MLKIRKIVCTAFMTVMFVSLTLATTNGVSQAEGGTITGVVTAPQPKYKKDCVVYIENVPGNWPPAKNEHIDQKGLVFIPHVLPILVNTTVEFLNHDNVLHNVFTPDKIADKFNLGTWPPGEIKTYTFKQTGVAILLCKVHSEMEGYTVVLQNPFFSLTDENGNYSIKDVPAGSYTLKVWNKKFRAAPKQIEIKDGQTLQTNFELKK